MQIKLAEVTLTTEDEKWVIASDSEGSGDGCWYDLTLEVKSSEKDLAAIARGITQSIEKEDMKNYICIRTIESLDVYKRPVSLISDVGDKINIIEASRSDTAAYLVESVFNKKDLDTPIGALFFSINSTSCVIHYVPKLETIVWKREILVFKNGRIKEVTIPSWMHDDCGNPETLIAGVSIKTGPLGEIEKILEENKSRTLTQGLSLWLAHEKAKSKFKVMAAYIGCGVAAFTYVAGALFSNQAESYDSEIAVLSTKKEDLQSNLTLLSKDAFLINWLTTPSIITAMRDVTSALGDSARITSMKGTMEIGRNTTLEGLAQAINGNLEKAKVPGMRMETVVTQGRIGIRFKIQRSFHGKEM